MLKLIRFRGIWIKMRFLILRGNELPPYGSSQWRNVPSHRYITLITITSAKSSRPSRSVHRAPILIQNRITVTRCTHNTLLYHLYIMLEKERTKKKKSKIIFFLSIQKRGDLSTSCIRDYLSVTSCPPVPITLRERRIVSPEELFFIRSVTWISPNTKWPLRSCRISTF